MTYCDLYYKNENGEYLPWRSIKEGIYRVKAYDNGKEINFLHICDLPEALKISQIKPFESQVASDLFKYFEAVLEGDDYLSVSKGMKIFMNTVKEAAREDPLLQYSIEALEDIATARKGSDFRRVAQDALLYIKSSMKNVDCSEMDQILSPDLPMEKDDEEMYEM